MVEIRPDLQAFEVDQAASRAAVRIFSQQPVDSARRFSDNRGLRSKKAKNSA
jgi:hypothetical protein